MAETFEKISAFNGFLNMTQYFFNRKYKALPHSIEGNKNREKCLKALINKENFKKVGSAKIKINKKKRLKAFKVNIKLWFPEN